jgi:hypothetical protein
VIESTFRPKALTIIIFVLLLLLAGAVYIVIEKDILLIGFHDTSIFFLVFFPGFFLYILILLIWGELRTKVIKVYIGKDSISKKVFLGLGVKRQYQFKDINGLKTSLVFSRGGTFEYLYIIVDDKKVVKISEFYHRNYKELKRTLMIRGVKNLGNEDWSFLRETREIFNK